jgi:hypothetical protein
MVSAKIFATSTKKYMLKKIFIYMKKKYPPRQNGLRQNIRHVNQNGRQNGRRISATSAKR